MLWFRRAGRSPNAAAHPDAIVPAEPPLALDADRFAWHFGDLVRVLEGAGGAEVWLERLAAKQRLFARALEAAREGALGLDGAEELLGRVFTARRWLYPPLAALGSERVAARLAELAGGAAPLAARMRAFADALAQSAAAAPARVRRAAWDFAAELLHFGDPARYPLMSRWVWDRATQSGALREFVRGAEALAEMPFDDSPELFEGTRRWIAERVAERGLYREVPLWTDLVLAQAYTGYLRSIAQGSLGAGFGGALAPREQLVKLLGLDAGARVRKTAPAGRA